MDLTGIILSGVGIALGVSAVSVIVTNLRKLLREVAEVLIAIDDMLEDGNISKEEIKSIKKEAMDVWLAVKDFKK